MVLRGIIMNNNFLQVDWLGFTFKGDPSSSLTLLQQFNNVFPEFDFRLLEVPQFRTSYNTSFLYMDIVISYNDLTKEDYSPSQVAHLYNMGVNVQVPSHCLEMFCKMFGLDIDLPSTPYELIQLIYDRGCKLSRIDLCFDDYCKAITTKFYLNAWSEQRISSPFIRSITAMGSDQNGYTFYVGSLKNRRKLLRIYDKFMESKDREDFKDCVRYEFELHTDDADTLGHYIIDNFGNGIPFADFLYKWIRVKDRESALNNKTIYNAKDDPAWVSALKLDLTLNYPIRIVKNDKPVGELTRFVEKMAVQSLAGYVKAFGSQALFQLIEDAIQHDQIKDTYRRYIQKLKYSEGFQPYSGPFGSPFV